MKVEVVISRWPLQKKVWKRSINSPLTFAKVQDDFRNQESVVFGAVNYLKD